MLHNDVTTIAGKGLQHYTKEPKLIDGKLTWVDGVVQSLDDKVLRSIDAPFQPDGGLRLMQGRLTVVLSRFLRLRQSTVK